MMSGAHYRPVAIKLADLPQRKGTNLLVACWWVPLAQAAVINGRTAAEQHTARHSPNFLRSCALLAAV
jgi:hypothetical protein